MIRNTRCQVSIPEYEYPYPAAWRFIVTKTESHRHNIKLLNLSINYNASNAVHWLLFTQLNDYTMPYFMADKERTERKKEWKKTGKTNKTAKDENRIGNHNTICHRVRNGVRNYTDTWWKSENDVIGWDTTKWHHHLFIYTYIELYIQELWTAKGTESKKNTSRSIMPTMFCPMHKLI